MDATPIRKTMAPVPGCKCQDGDRHPRQRADHAQELERQVGQVLHRAGAADENAEGNADCSRPAEPKRNARKAWRCHCPDLARGDDIPEAGERRLGCKARERSGARVAFDQPSADPPDEIETTKADCRKDRAARPGDEPPTPRRCNSLRAGGGRVFRPTVEPRVEPAAYARQRRRLDRHTCTISSRTYGSPLATLTSVFHSGNFSSAFLTKV